MQLCFKMLSGLANSVDSNQEQSALFAYGILSDTSVFEIIGH